MIDEVKGRRIRIADHWLADFASCNYLGFDLEPEIIDSVDDALREWGTHPTWSRLLGSPRLYVEIEDRLTELLGAEDTPVLPTITHIHMSVIPPSLAGAGSTWTAKPTGPSTTDAPWREDSGLRCGTFRPATSTPWRRCSGPPRTT